MFNNKNVFIISFVFLFFITMSAAFAMDNETVDADEAVSASEKIDIYFDANADYDGDGTKENPYNMLNSIRIVNNSNIHLTDGEYFVNTTYVYSDGIYIHTQYNLNLITYSSGYSFSPFGLSGVSFYGQSADKTIIRGFDNRSMNFKNSLYLSNITFINDEIVFDGGNLTLNNVVFKNSNAHYWDNYHNEVGSAISVTKYSDIEIYNSKFINLTSEYGGAIYMPCGSLKIVNSSFTDITSTLLGGALYCNNTYLIVSNSKFNNCRSKNSDGGAIYLMDCEFNAYDLNFTGCYSGFGGAICSLNSKTSIDNSCFENNYANYSNGVIFAAYGELNILNSGFINNNVSVVVNDVEVNISNSNFTSEGVEIISYFTSLNLNNNHGLTSGNVIEINEISFNRISDDYPLFTFNLTEFTGILPDYYSLVDDGYVTSVKNQKNGGNCWAFTAMSVLESCILKLTGKTYDLSEQNLKNIMACYSNWGWNSETNNGGKIGMSLGYFTSWMGPVLDITDQYSDRNVLSNLFDAVFHIDNVLLLKRNNFTDNDDVKRAILTYGAVGGDLFYQDSMLNENTNAYYCYSNFGSNHAVTIVGWNDTYSKDNFITTPEGDGAWIVKNSWSSDWGDNGYFYVSYYDKSVSVGDNSYLYTIILNNTKKYDKIYQYDLGYSTVFSLSTTTSKYKNIFNATGDEYLTAVSTYFFDPVNCTVSIYVNDEFIMNKTCSLNAGYHTIDLDRLIELKTGDLFTVMIYQNTTGDKVKVPMMNYKDFKNYIPHENISYYHNNLDWLDASIYGFEPSVICIKAFTVKGYDASIQLNVSNNFIEATVRDAEGNLLTEGNITFKINDYVESVEIKNGVAGFEYDFIHLEYYEITATLNAVGYKNASLSNTVYHKLDMNLSVGNTDYGKDIVINVTLNNDMVLNNNVTITVLDKNYSFAVLNQNNSYIISDVFDAGNYTVYLRYNDHFNNITKNESFMVLKAVNSISVSVDDVIYPDKIVVNVKADVSGVYTVKINETLINVSVVNGSGFKDISLGVGEYSADVVWSNDNYQTDIKNTKFKVSKHNVTLTAGVNIDFNDAVITLTLSSPVNFTVEVNVSGDVRRVNIKNGEGVLTLNDLAQGFYELSVLFADSNYELISKPVNFTISTYTANVDIEVSNISVGDVLDISVNVSSDNSQKPTGNVTVYINNISKTDKLINGNVKFSISDLISGNYTAWVFYEGDGIYGPGSSNASFTVSKVVPVITVSDSIVYGKSIAMRLSEGLTGKLILSLDGTHYAVSYTGYNFLVNIPDLSVGSHDLFISYEGDDKYSPLNISASLQVNKLNSALSASSIASNVIASASGLSYSVYLKDENNNALANKAVSLIFDGKSYYGVTNSNGLYNFKLFSNSVGFKTVTIKFDGDETHNAVSLTRSVNLVKVKTSLKVSKKTYKKSAKSKKLQATLKDASGHIIKGVKVVFKVKSKKYSGTTNAKGIASVNVKLSKKGSYKVAVSFSGNAKYYSVSKSTILKIK